MIPASDRYPDATVEIHFGAGAQSQSDAPIKVLAIGYGYTGGSVAVNTITQCLSADDAMAKFGPGSQLHLAAIAFFEEYPAGTFYAILYAQAGGGVACARLLTITNTATLGGSLGLELNGRFIQVGIDAGMTVGAQQSAIIAAWNAQTTWFARASAGMAGEVLLTAKWKGPSSNQMQVRVTPTGITGSTYAVTTSAAGATDGDPATALAAIGEDEYDLFVVGTDHSDVTTGIPPALLEVNSRSTPIRGLNSKLVAANTGSYGTVTALTLALNAHRGQVWWDRNSNMLSIEIAAKVAAWRALYRQNDPTANLIKNGGGNKVFNVWRGPYAKGDRISRVEATQGLNNGVSSIRYTRQGTAYMVRGITTRFQDTNGGPDYRTLDDIKVDMLDYFAFDLRSNFPVKFPDYKLREDSNLPPADRVADPRLIRSWIWNDFLKTYEQRGWLKNVDKWAGNFKVTIPTAPSGRANASIPVDVIDLFAQLDADLYQLG